MVFIFREEFRHFAWVDCAGDFAAISALRAALRAVTLRNAPAGAAGGEVLSQRWESTQRIAGGRLRMDTSCPYSPYPRTPITGDAYLSQGAEFPARKI